MRRAKRRPTVGVSLGISRLRAELPSLARLRSRVLVLGESGTGKEEVAQALASLAQSVALRHGPGRPAAASGGWRATGRD